MRSVSNHTKLISYLQARPSASNTRFNRRLDAVVAAVPVLAHLASFTGGKIHARRRCRSRRIAPHLPHNTLDGSGRSRPVASSRRHRNSARAFQVAYDYPNCTDRRADR